MKITSGQTFTLQNNLTLNNEELIIEAGGVFIFDPNKTLRITTSRNIIVDLGGLLVMKPAGHHITHEIAFAGIDENKFKGGGMVPLPDDVGLWAMASGLLDLLGTYKKPFTTATADVRRNATTATMKDASGWQVGDEVVFAYMEMPGPSDNVVNWDANTRQITDSHFVKFERRKIASINGNAITWTGPLLHDHLLAIADSGVLAMPYVGNLTRNVKIHGTPTGRSHIFSCAHGAPNPDGSIPHYKQLHPNLKYFEIYDMGPRFHPDGEGRTELVTGRYGLHFHHCGNGSVGIVVEGCAMHDCGNRGFVPHLAHGITIQNNVAFNHFESQLWWDWQEQTHRANWNSNLLMACRMNGHDSNSRAVHLSMGNDNSCTENVVIYGHQGDENGGGGYAWDADNEGVWFFKNNLAIGCRTGAFVWQNSVYVHLQTAFITINCYRSISHGAYGNMYLWERCKFYASQLLMKSSAAASNAMGLHDTLFDGLNKMGTLSLIDIQPSPVNSGATPNILRNCTFKNAQVALWLSCNMDHSDNQPKIVDVINCTFVNIGTKFMFGPGPLDCYFRVQEPNGSAIKISKSGQVSIPQFAPLTNGAGEGLTAEYYNGENFESLAFTRTDHMIVYQQWRKDPPIYPLGVNDRITGAAFSIRWIGKIEGQYTQLHTFRIWGASKSRVWIDGKLIINSWVEKGDQNTNIDSATVPIIQGFKHDIKIEASDSGNPPMGIVLYWKSPGMSRYNEVPTSQLYPSGFIPPPPPLEFLNAAFTKPFTRNNCAAGSVGSIVNVTVTAGQFKSATSQADADLQANVWAQKEANAKGTCTPITTTFKNIEKRKDFTRNNCGVNATGSVYTYIVPAGKHTSTVSQSLADAAADTEIATNGQAEANLKGICTPIPVGKKLLVTLKVYDDGSVEPVKA